MKSFSSRLRTWLVIVAIVAVVPAIAATLYIQSIERGGARERTIADNLRLVRAAANRRGTVFDGAHRLLLTLVKFPQLGAADPEACQTLLAKVLADHPAYFNLLVTNVDGTIFCSARPIDPARYLRTHAWFERAIRTGTSTIGDYQISATTGKPALVVSEPLFDRSGAVTRVAAASIAVSEFDIGAHSDDLPRGVTLALFDRSRTILSRFPDPEAWVGKQIPDESQVRQIDAGASEFVRESAGIDGVRRLYVTVPVRAFTNTGLYMGMGVEDAIAFEDADRTFRRYLLLLGLVALASVVAALAAAQMFVLRPVADLTSVSRRTEAELRATEGRYRHLFEHHPHPMWIFDRVTLQFVEVNDSAVRVYGYSRSEFLAMKITDIRPPEDIPQLEANLADNREPWARSRGWRHRLKSGDIINVEIASYLFTSEGRDVELIAAVDVTDRTRAEAALAERTGIMTLTADIGVALNLPHDLRGCLRRSAEAIVAQLDAIASQIWTCEPSTGALELQAHAGDSLALDEASLADCARDRQQRFVNRMAICPLLVGPRTVGVLVVARPRQLSETLKTSLGSVADLLALGIERHWADEARRTSDQRFQLIANTITQAFWIADPGLQKLVYVSPAYETIWGRPLQTLYDDPRSFLDAVHLDDRENFIKHLTIIEAGAPASHEYRIVRPDGEIRWVWNRGYPVHAAGGGALSQYVGIMHDITERKQAEIALQHAEQRMRFALEAAHVGVWETNLATGEAYWSETCERMHGLAPGTFGRSLDAFVAIPREEDRPKVAAAIERAIREHKDAELEYHVVWPDGTVRHISTFGRFSYTPAGEPVTGAGVSVDVTDRRSLEEQLRQSQKMEAIGQLAGGVAHDFNNLLTAIQGFAGLLAETLGDSDPRREDVAEIQRAAERAAGLTRQLLAFSRKQILSVRVLHVGDVIGDLSPMLRRLLGEGIDLRTTVGDRRLVKADPGQLQQVIMNLAVNARDAMPTGGKLTLETADVVLDARFARSHPSVVPGPHVMIAVTDTGCGMDVETQKKIFEPFFTTKPKDRGTGLGLATVYGIVKQSGGSIWVASEVGRGTTFEVYLPCTQDVVAEASPARDARPAGGDETVLLIEDEDLVRDFVARVLQRHGYTVHALPDPQRAIEYAGTHGGPIDLVFTDVVLPDMSGRALVQELQSAHPESRVLYMSGYADHAIVDHGVLEAGTAFLQKPFSADALARKVRDVLDA
jgi:PAS domain S-box-containing protein